MNFKELRQQSGMNLTQFSKYFDIPYRTVQNWERGERQCPGYLLDLMKYKLKKENIIGNGEEIYLISLDNSDAYHEYSQAIGYIRGTKEEAIKCCDDLNQRNQALPYRERDCGEFLYEILEEIGKDK